MDQQDLNTILGVRCGRNLNPRPHSSDTTRKVKKLSMYRSHGFFAIQVIMAKKEHHDLRTGFIQSEHKNAK